jgi:hypothetical protein
MFSSFTLSPLVVCLALFWVTGSAAPLQALGVDSGSSRAARPAFSAATFAQPPVQTRPYVLWYWMNGHISEEGIRADLDGFARAGIGGVHIVNVGMTFIKGPVRFNTPAGIGMIKYAIREAGARGIKVALYNGAGWSARRRPSRILWRAPNTCCARAALWLMCSTRAAKIPPASRWPWWASWLPARATIMMWAVRRRSSTACRSRRAGWHFRTARVTGCSCCPRARR